MDIVTHWRLKEIRYRFAGAVCPTCGHRALPLRRICPICGTSSEKAALQGGVIKLAQLDLKELTLLLKG